MNGCKTNRRIKRRNLDERAKCSTILHKWGFDSVRRTKRVLIYPAVRREKPNALKQTYNDSFLKKMDGVGSDLK